MSSCLPGVPRIRHHAGHCRVRLTLAALGGPVPPPLRGQQRPQDSAAAPAAVVAGLVRHPAPLADTVGRSAPLPGTVGRPAPLPGNCSAARARALSLPTMAAARAVGA